MLSTINLDIDRPRLHAVQFKALVNHYLKERSRHLDPITIKGYRLRLNYFLSWWDDEGPDREWVLDEDAFGNFADYVKALPAIAWWTRHDALRRLRQVLRWSHGRNYVEMDFSEFVPSMPGTPPPKFPVDLGILDGLLDACEETKEPERNRAIIAVLAGTGVRCEECAAMRVEKVLVYEDGSGLINLSVAKNSDLRPVAFDPTTGTILCEWIVMLPYASGPLFPSRNGRNTGDLSCITPSGQHKMLCKIIDLAEVKGHIQGAHDLRRMFATTWARQLPAELPKLQRQMGHRDLGTTLKYVLNDASDIREVMSEKPVSPIAVLAARLKAPKPVTPKQFYRTTSGSSSR